MPKKKETKGDKPAKAQKASKAGVKAVAKPARKAAAPKSRSEAAPKVSRKASPKSKSAPKASAARGVAKADTIESALLENLGDLPFGYGTDTIYLVAQDPNWIFTYWDIDITRHPGGPCHLRVEDGVGALEQEIEVPFETRNWYVPVRTAGGAYSVELGFYRSRKWNSIARSAQAVTPRDRMSDSMSFDFATLPLHISFQRLVEAISSSPSNAAVLVPAMAEMQKLLASAGNSQSFLQEQEKAILVSLLGSAFLQEISSGQWSSEELHSAIFARLRERLSSGQLGELVGRLQLGHAESSLFSAFSQLGAEVRSGSWNLASAGFAEKFAGELSSWMVAALSSWSGLARGFWSSGAFSSEFFAGGAGGSETLGGSETFALRSLSSWNEFMSWFGAVGSSWSGAELSSFAQSALSSWGSEFLSSWGSGGLSSWGASENSFGVATSRRALDLEVAAEITLRGKTEPGGRLKVGSELVEVGADGSFEHTVVFKGGRGELPIEAVSPDGSRTRRTALVLQPASI
jgi:hypothetical protein